MEGNMKNGNIIEFLLGEKPYNGERFIDKPPFWWRRELAKFAKENYLISSKTEFKQGDIVESDTETILVTGDGDYNDAEYNWFAGVVLKSNGSWNVGEYSETWPTVYFRLSNYKL